MPNPWFKFYGMEYLGDPKIDSLSPAARSCWITLLCYASENGGVVFHLSEQNLMLRAGLDVTRDEWDDNVGVLSRFVKLDMIEMDDNGVITLKNWQKRQETSLTAYERVKRFREKKRMITDDNGVDNVVDKIREDKNINTSQTTEFSKKYLEKFKSPPEKVYSSSQLLASEISEWSHGKLTIPMLMKFCKSKGEQFVRDCWASAKDSTADDPVKIFMYKYGQTRVEIKEARG
jgi:hypothetical protein